MEKISSQQVKTLLKTASATIRGLQTERDEFVKKLAHYERKERAEKIASAMEEKGLNAELSFQEKVAFLLDETRAPNLDVTEEAVKIASTQRGVLGGLGENVGGTGNSASAFENYILTGESPE